MGKDRDGYKDGTKHPIKPAGYIHGVKIVDIGDLRVSRGHARYEVSTCRHKELVYCSTERAIWCDDCETRLDPFDVFKLFVERSDAAAKRIKYLKELEDLTLISRASKALDEDFRSRMAFRSKCI